MTTRRSFLRQIAAAPVIYPSLFTSSNVIAASCNEIVKPNVPGGLRMPAEWHPHEASWMAYGATVGAWGDSNETSFDRDLSNSRIVARQDLVRLAANLSRFEKVYLLVHDDRDEAQARHLLEESLAQSSVKDQFSGELDASGRIYIGPDRKVSDLPDIGTFEIVFLRASLDDLWTRDTAPVMSMDPRGELYGANLNFNGWGQWPVSSGLCDWRKDPEKTLAGVIDQPVGNDRKVAGFINDYLELPEIETWLTAEGGGFEVNGEGLGMAMESSIINDNRNPGKSKSEIEAELRKLFGIEHMIWMPGLKGKELTDWHVDFTARFVSQNKIVAAFDRNFEPADNRNEVALHEAIDELNSLPANLKKKYLGSRTSSMELHMLPVPDIEQVYESYRARNLKPLITGRSMEEFIETTAPGYIGYTHANGAIIMGQFGDTKADLEAFNSVQALYPEHTIIQITTDGLASGGGTIHCATQQQPAV